MLLPYFLVINEMSQSILLSKDGLVFNLEDLKFTSYPYTYTRVAAMRSQLFKRSDYDKMMKMSVNEILKYLQDHGYAKQINNLIMQYSGFELLERAIHHNLADKLNKLKKISEGALKKLIDIYLTKIDIHNIKTILRGVIGGMQNEEVEKTLISAGSVPIDELKLYIKKETVEEALESMHFIHRSEIKRLLEYYHKDKNLIRIENRLDKAYYMTLFAMAKKMPKHGKIFQQYLMMNAQVVNILTLIRVKKLGLQSSIIKKSLIDYGTADHTTYYGSISYLNTLINMDFDEMLKNLLQTPFGKYIDNGVEYYKKNGSIMKIEVGLQKALLDLTLKLQHANPVTLDVILGYMFAKEIEIRNLSVIIKGKSLNVEEDFIQDQLIIGADQ
jgi:V/A-type H+/Na+-transporting ATPase subunit C